MIDLSHLNGFVRLTPFKMETVSSVLLSVREGDFLASIDLQDAYFQIPVHQSSRKLLRFLSEGTVYQFKALCFGLLTAPQVFTSVFTAVSAWAHSHGIRLLRYLDDWLVLASSEAEARQNVQDLLSLCHSLRIVINEGKSDLVPSQTANYLGMTIDTGAARIFPSCASREISVGGGDVLCFDRSPRSALAGDLGSPGFAGEAGTARLPSNALPAVAFEDALVPRVRFSFPSGAPSQEVREDLSWWMVRDHLLLGVRFGTPAPDLHLYSDASRSGWVRTPPRSGSILGVVGTGEVAAHQSPGNEGFVSGIAVIPGVGRRSPCDRDVRQLDGGGLRQQAGRDGLPFSACWPVSF